MFYPSKRSLLLRFGNLYLFGGGRIRLAYTCPVFRYETFNLDHLLGWIWSENPPICMFIGLIWVGQPSADSIILDEVIALNYSEDIGDRIYELRAEHGLSQRQLAAAIHINRSSIRDWELHVSKPSTDALVILAVYFNVPVDYLLGVQLKDWIKVSHLSERQRDVVFTLLELFRDLDDRAH